MSSPIEMTARAARAVRAVAMPALLLVVACPAPPPSLPPAPAAPPAAATTSALPVGPAPAVSSLPAAPASPPPLCTAHIDRATTTWSSSASATIGGHAFEASLAISVTSTQLRNSGVTAQHLIISRDSESVLNLVSETNGQGALHTLVDLGVGFHGVTAFSLGSTDRVTFHGSINGKQLAPFRSSAKPESLRFRDGRPVPAATIDPDLQQALPQLMDSVQGCAGTVTTPAGPVAASPPHRLLDSVGHSSDVQDSFACVSCVAGATTAYIACSAGAGAGSVACGPFIFICLPGLLATCFTTWWLAEENGCKDPAFGSNSGSGPCCPQACGIGGGSFGTDSGLVCCNAGETCIGTTGLCCSPGLSVCGSSNCCTQGDSCVAGLCVCANGPKDDGCCPASQACNGTCCEGGSSCQGGTCACPSGSCFDASGNCQAATAGCSGSSNNASCKNYALSCPNGSANAGTCVATTNAGKGTPCGLYGKCSDGVCVCPSGMTMCGPACCSGRCVRETCLAPCPSGQTTCGDVCCSGGETCVKDNNGNSVCCASGSNCNRGSPD